MDKCKKCGAELKENQKFCSECGTPVNQKCVCRKCGIELEPETKFCPECGTNQTVSASFSESFTTLQKINFEKVSKEFYTSTNWERLLSLITPVYEKHPENEEVFYYYLQILIESDLEAAKDAVSSLNDELFEVCCAKFDIAIKENNLPKAENILEKAESKWNDNKILKYKRALFLLTLGAKEENDDCIADALALLASIENPTDKREERENSKSFNVIDYEELCDLEFVPELIKKIAEHGNSEGQKQLGNMYFNGTGVEQDSKEAVKWFRKSAEQGDDSGQVDLGNMYFNGKGVEQDYKEAVKWFRKAAEQGSYRGQYALGTMYYLGTGVEKNYAEAVKWYRKAAEHGNFIAMELLGSLFEHGKGVEQDYKEAVKWYRKAAEHGNFIAMKLLGSMFEQGKGVEQDYEEAVKWYKKAAEQGNSIGQFHLGSMYENGRGVEQDEEEAVKWFRKSAEQGYITSKEALERLADQGILEAEQALEDLENS